MTKIIASKLAQGLCLTALMIAGAEASESDQIRRLAHDYARGADSRDVGLLARVLHDKFRVTVFWHGKLTMIDKAGYLAMVKAKKIGGDKRRVKVHTVEATGSVASVRATFSGRKLLFKNHLHLVKDGGRWQLIADAPSISPRK